MHDAGDAISTNNGQASAVFEDIITRTHSEVVVFGVSTRGCSLLNLPGVNELSWSWPREPLDAEGKAGLSITRQGPTRPM